MGNCFISKPKKEPSHTQQDSNRRDQKDTPEGQNKAIELFKLKQKDKVDTITEKIDQSIALLAVNEEKKESLLISPPEVEIKQRREARNNKLVQVVIQEDEPIVENVRKLDKQKGPSDYQLILNALEQHYFFAQISAQHKEDIVYKMFYCTVPQGQYIFQQGDKASSYFIIDKGSCEIIIHGEIKKTINNGAAFGELALLYNAPRSASIKTTEDSYFWGIDRGTFRKAVEELVQSEYQENRKFIDSIQFFDMMSSDQKDTIANVIITQQFKKGDIIVNEGDMASSYFIIKSGLISITKGGKEIRKMSAGDSFGEQALYSNSVRGATVIADSDLVKCLALGRDILTKILGDKISVIIYNNTLRWAFQKHKTLQKLTQMQIEKVVSKIESVQKKNGDVILKSGEKCDKIVIVLEGKITDGIITIPKGGMIGEEYLTQENFNKLLPKDFIINEEKGEAKIAQISFETFLTAIGGQLELIIKKNENSHEVKYMKNQQKKENYDHLKLADLIHIKKLGFGQFGSVYLVKNKNDKKLYALKSIVKNQITEQSLEKHLLQEKKVLESVQFPLIMQYIKPLKDQNYVYFLVEYIKGMELFDVIREIGLLNTYDSQFYIGSLILCMEYLHTHSIIYRDIKPENIMVDQAGYMKLIDMGTAKFLKGKGGRTFTIIGTPHYMAPEIITGKGYTYSVDIWSIGVCLYEFMCGGVPFAEEAEDPYEIYEEIVKKPLTYPSFLKDRKAKKLMDQLLNKTPEIRLGGSYPQLKANMWFEHFDWDKLMDRELKPPFIPPKDKIITDKEIQKKELLAKPVVEEIKNDGIKDHKDIIYHPEKAKDLNWDKEF